MYPRGSSEENQLTAEYVKNGEGSYVLETAYSIPEIGTRLCFDATRRYRDIARLINHSMVGCNLKPCRPIYIRGKWRVPMMAVRDIFVGQEITYDYGVRSEEWMKRRREKSEADDDDVSDEPREQKMDTIEETVSCVAAEADEDEPGKQEMDNIEQTVSSVEGEADEDEPREQDMDKIEETVSSVEGEADEDEPREQDMDKIEETVSSVEGEADEDEPREQEMDEIGLEEDTAGEADDESTGSTKEITFGVL